MPRQYNMQFSTWNPSIYKKDMYHPFIIISCTRLVGVTFILKFSNQLSIGLNLKLFTIWMYLIVIYLHTVYIPRWCNTQGLEFGNMPIQRVWTITLHKYSLEIWRARGKSLVLIRCPKEGKKIDHVPYGTRFIDLPFIIWCKSVIWGTD